MLLSVVWGWISILRGLVDGSRCGVGDWVGDAWYPLFLLLSVIYCIGCAGAADWSSSVTKGLFVS